MAKKEKYPTYKRSSKRKELYNYYIEKYKRLFINKFIIEGIENDNALRYFLQELFVKGKIWISNIKYTDEVYFTPFAPVEYDPYFYPLKVTLTPKLWASYIPQGIQEVNVDGVIGYITEDTSSPLNNIKVLIDKIVDVEMVLDNQLILHKLAWFVFVNPEDKDRMKQVIQDLLSDDVALFGGVEDYQSLKPFNSNINYIIDKLREYLKDIENEILTILGINNIPHEKKEHLIVDEVNSNNAIVEEQADKYLQALKDTFNRVYDVLGINLSVRLKSSCNCLESTNNEEIEDEEVEDDENV